VSKSFVISGGKVLSFLGAGISAISAGAGSSIMPSLSSSLSAALATRAADLSNSSGSTRQSIFVELAKWASG
jgi:hypothetical protein